MNGEELREARRRKDWTQERTAERLGVTQAYLSMVERGRRVLPYSLARRAAEVLDAPATALPLREETFDAPTGSEKLRAELAALGYPGFAHLAGEAKARKARRNPAEVLLNALNHAELDSRVTEGLPWLTAKYAGMNWDWLVPNAKVRDRQNRLGFVATLALQLAAETAGREAKGKLREYVGVLERSRLVKEDTLCHDSLTAAEREWLRANRPAEARHWNLLTDMKVENLPHGRS